MAAMEGIAMGVPTIAPDSGPFPYLVKHGVNGLLFKPDCVADLRAQINKALDDNRLYIHLAQGAKESGKKLLNPPVIYLQSLEQAFAMLET